LYAETAKAEISKLNRLQRLRSKVVTKPSRYRIDMTGQKLHGVVVLSYFCTLEGRAYWTVQCLNCASTYNVCGHKLRKGKARKCECQAPDRDHLIGKPFGRGTVIARAGVDEYENALWRLRCSCPDKTEYTARTGDLTDHKTTSCGCARREKVAAANKTRRRRLDALYTE
jgi:hypothetical protein